MIQRERFQTYQQYTFLGRIFASIAGLDARYMARAEDLLSLAIFHTAYDPYQIQEHMQQTERALRAERNARLQDARLMAKVDSYTEYDESATDADAMADNQSVMERAFSKRSDTSSTVKFTGQTKPWR